MDALCSSFLHLLQWCPLIGSPESFLLALHFVKLFPNVSSFLKHAVGLWAAIQEEGMNDGASAKFLFPAVSASFNPKLQPCFLPEMHMLWFSAKFWSPLYLINPLHTRLEFLCFPNIGELNSVTLYFRLLSSNNAKSFLYICYLLRDHTSYPFPLIRTEPFGQISKPQTKAQVSNCPNQMAFERVLHVKNVFWKPNSTIAVCAVIVLPAENLLLTCVTTLNCSFKYGV